MIDCILCKILCWGTGIVAFVLFLGWRIHGHFRRNGIKNPTVYIPFVGHMLPFIIQNIHFKDFVYNIYTQFGDTERYFGLFQFHRPMVVLKDVEIIKQVTVKDFDHFVDRGGAAIDEDADLIFGNSLLSLKGQKWRDMRATLSPAFTSSKMRGMFQFVVDCGEQMADYYMKQLETTENRARGILELEMKDAFTRYANDVIATSAFGLQVNSFTEKDNQFYMMGKDATDFSGRRFLKIFVLSLFPKLSKMLNVRFLSDKLTNFYRTLVWDTINNREKNNIFRNDMIQLLMEAKKGTLKHDTTKDDNDAGFATVEESAVGKVAVKRVWTDDDIVAQALLFFVAGFDTSSTVLCFTAHELALNPNVQKRLQEEIDEVAASLDGKLTYDALLKMKYLDMVVSESLRKWPALVVMDRRCVKPYTLPPANNNAKEYEMKLGDVLWIPVYPLHRDSKYFKDPETFDPERFSDENKHNIIPGTYLPFGMGPRNCIGSRFALMEVKAVIYNILRKFDIITTAKTQNPIKMNLKTFSMHSEKGFWVGLRPR